MSLLTDEHPPAKHARGAGARAWQVVSIVMIVLTPWVFYDELKDAYKNGVALETPENSKTFTGRLETAVKAQLAVLQKVDSGALGFTYYKTLESTECNWFFRCSPIRVVEPPNPLSAQIFNKPLTTLSPAVSDALKKGTEMALAPRTSTPAATPPAGSSTIALPPSIKFHETTGGPLSGGAGELIPVPRESEADRLKRENISRIEQNLKTEGQLSLPGLGNPGGSSAPAKAVTNPVPPRASIPPAPLPHVITLPNLSDNLPSTFPAIKTVTAYPAIFTRLGPIRLPTLYTIRGTPHAFGQMVIAIEDAGFWAMAMYLCCTLIWITLWLRKMPVMLYFLLLGGPLSIPLMVTLLQWLCEGLLKLGLVGCAIAAGMMALLPSTALALLVGAHHVVKTPRELFEAVERLKG